MRSSVTVLGGGVSGISTAILLQLVGYKVTIVAELLPLGDEYAKANPRFQTVIAAASVIPHSTAAEDMQTILRDSMAFFNSFLDEKVVRLQHHYELFEVQPELPDYKDAVDNFQVLTEEYQQTHKIPKRSGINTIYGWHFNAYFVEMPKYLELLFAIFKDLGGTIERRKISKDDLATLAGDLLINCTGSWSGDLFENTLPAQFIRGHLVLISGLELPTDEDENIFSYNYTPSKEVYSTKSGRSNDVYFYPREDVWIVGGSRQVGELSDNDDWQGDDSLQPTIDVGGVQVPQPIVDVNKDILEQLTGVDITKHPMRTIVGYRYATTPLRIETAEEHDRTVIHNYGHGGAGVTTSWGSSLRVLKLAQKLLPQVSPGDHVANQSAIIDRLRKTLMQRG